MFCYRDMTFCTCDDNCERSFKKVEKQYIKDCAKAGFEYPIAFSAFCKNIKKVKLNSTSNQEDSKNIKNN